MIDVQGESGSSTRSSVHTYGVRGIDSSSYNRGFPMQHVPALLQEGVSSYNAPEDLHGRVQVCLWKVRNEVLYTHRIPGACRGVPRHEGGVSMSPLSTGPWKCTGAIQTCPCKTRQDGGFK